MCNYIYDLIYYKELPPIVQKQNSAMRNGFVAEDGDDLSQKLCLFNQF